jgi:hypothetical protein
MGAMTEAKRIPAKGDRISALGQEGMFQVFRVHENPETVDLKLVGGTGLVLKGIHWDVLTFLDKPSENFSQAASQKR